jgi:hypothetical protein
MVGDSEGSIDVLPMQKKCLFLDFDGVLHPGSCSPLEYFCQMPVLETALGGANVDIVVSSSWRFHHEWGSLVERFPAPLRASVRGCTGDAVRGPQARWNEIRQYREQHAVRDWRALDDCAFEFPPDCAELILCNGATGLAEREVQMIRTWLGR